MSSKISIVRSKISEKIQSLNKGRALFTAFMLPTAMTFLPMNAYAANDTIWTKASEIMQDVYTQVLGISTIAAIVTAKAAQALTSYLGYSAEGGGVTPSGGSAPASGVPAPSVDAGVASETGVSSGPAIPAEPIGNEDVITLDGGIAGAGVPFAADTPAGEVVSGAAHVTAADEVSTAENEHHQIPAQPPTFRDVEIGGGRITGYETPAGGGAERQFAMYNAGQYMTPTGDYETVETADGETWYKQYAQPTVERTPYEESSGQIKYNEKIVEQMPQIPKRKDRV